LRLVIRFRLAFYISLMQTSHHTILITGGATGIGLALAKALLPLNNHIIICGRRADKLAEVQAAHPAIATYVCDLEMPSERVRLAQTLLANHPRLSILINNAGIQRELDFRQTPADYWQGSSETAINLDAALHLTALLMPHLLRQPQAAVVNVSSGLGLVPLIVAPIYSATKAALHSFSISLRRQLAGTTVQVFEVLPPIVETELDQGARARRGQTALGISPEQVAAETLKGLAADNYEIAVGRVKALRIGARIAPGFFLRVLNKVAKPK
jgi:uncharacterized oxidoreductase